SVHKMNITASQSFERSIYEQEPVHPMESMLLESWCDIERTPYISVNTTTLIDEDPEVFDGSFLFSQFHDQWRMSVNTPIDVPLKYSGLCELAVRRLPKFGTRVVYPEGFPNAKNIIELLTLEKHTWTLVAALYGDRLESELRGWVDTSAADFMAVRHSEREIAKLLYERDSGLREAQMLVDWLERRVREHIAEVAERYECLFNQTATW
ncbi:hypothetical protein CRM22_004780, partial [Opisthorchis felineus]